MRSRGWVAFLSMIVLNLAASALFAQVQGTRSERERAAIHDNVVRKKLDTVLGPAMKAHDIQMWIVLNREYNLDPVFPLVTPDGSYAGVRNAYIFVDDGGERPKRIFVGTHGHKQRAPFFDRTIRTPAVDKVLAAELRKLAEEYDPKRIGINVAHRTSAADGLTASLRDFLVEALGSKYASRLVSAESMVVEYLDTRLPEDEELFREAAEITRKVWEEALSNKVIQPGKTTVADVVWYIRQRCAEHAVPIWFNPGFRVQRRGMKTVRGEMPPDDLVLERGDVLHLDFGITYLDLSTDYQKHAYILREGESDVPTGLQQALANTNKLQDILLSEMKPGRKGTDVYAATMARAKAAGLQAMIYSHSIGHYGHFVGTAIESPTEGPVGDSHSLIPLRLGSYTSIELNTRTSVAEWNRQEVYISMEDDAVLTPAGMKFMIPRQTSWYVIGGKRPGCN